MIKCGVEDPVRSNGGPHSVLRQEMSLYDKPTRGTSMDEFKEMVHRFLKVHFPLVIYEYTDHSRKQKLNLFQRVMVNFHHISKW